VVGIKIEVLEANSQKGALYFTQAIQKLYSLKPR